MIIPIKDIAQIADRYLSTIEQKIEKTEMQIRASQANGRNVELMHVKLAVQVTGVVCAATVFSMLNEERPSQI